MASKRLDFVAERELWNVYTLENGVQIRARLVLVSVRDEGAINPSNGLPNYQLQFQQFVYVEYEDALEKGMVERKPVKSE